jgi:hypothetical protein
VWAAAAAGAGLGFVARDILGLPPPLVALAWMGGAAVGAASVCWLPPVEGGGERPSGERAGGSERDAGERGQAAVEWIGLLLLVALALGGAVAARPAVDGWSFGGFLAHRLVCAVRGGCGAGGRDGDSALRRAYGPGDAELVRAYAPGLVYEPGERELPVDWRRCRRRRCSEGPDDRDLDVHRSRTGQRATVFTRVVRRGGRTYIQYWFYYPDSNTTVAGSDKAWALGWLVPRLAGRRTPRYPGFHLDDWEGYLIRLDADGSAWARASAHGHWQTCKQKDCAGDWSPTTGWTRVSRGSHAGHIPLDTDFRRGGRRITPREAGAPRRRGPPVQRVQTPQLPGRDLDERTTTGEGLILIPLETLDTRRYRSRAKEADPPWTKEVYEEPDSDSS